MAYKVAEEDENWLTLWRRTGHTTFSDTFDKQIVWVMGVYVYQECRRHQHHRYNQRTAL